MKFINTIIYLALVVSSSFAQSQTSNTAISSPIFVKVTKTATKPPFLEVSDLKFIDANGNMKIDAEGVSKIQFKLRNTGLGIGKNLSIQVDETNKLNGLVYSKTTQLGDLDTGKDIDVIIPVEGDPKITGGVAAFKISVVESSGFAPDPISIEVPTQSFRAPSVKVVDHVVSSLNSTEITKRKPFDIQVLVQNIGQGVARDVTVKLTFPKNIFCISMNEVENIGNLMPGEKRVLNYNLIANNEYQDDKLPFDFAITEKFGKYAESNKISLAMNQTVSKEKLRIAGIDQQDVKVSVASLGSDVDKNIPPIGKIFPERIALIIGNEDYSGTLNAQINVSYAVRDAQIFKEYSKITLGIDEKNIFHFSNATAGVMKREIERIVKLAKKMGENTELYFYYAGHGFPDEKTKVPYLIPVDVDADNLSDGVSLKDLYTNLGSTGASKVTIFLDACFSGGGRDEGLLAARGIRIVPEIQECVGKMVVFAASKGDQVALPFHQEKHGLFTYYMLKKLQETKGKVSYKELYDYLRQQVGVESIRISKEQDPVINFSPVIGPQWEKWTF
jgi:hypothetical protein